MNVVWGNGFRTSSFCNVGGCVAVAIEDTGDVLLGDTKQPDRPPHAFTREEWMAFVAGVKNGEFDPPVPVASD